MNLLLLSYSRSIHERILSPSFNRHFCRLPKKKTRVFKWRGRIRSIWNSLNALTLPTRGEGWPGVTNSFITGNHHHHHHHQRLDHHRPWSSSFLYTFLGTDSFHALSQPRIARHPGAKVERTWLDSEGMEFNPRLQFSESSVERNSNESRRLIAPDDRPPITQHQRFFRSPLEDNNTGWNEKRRRGHAREIGASGSRGDTSAPFFPILSPPRFPFLSFLRSSLSPDSLWPAPLSRRCAGRSSRRRLAVDPSPRPCLRPWPPRRASPLLPS